MVDEMMDCPMCLGVGKINKDAYINEDSKPHPDASSDDMNLAKLALLQAYINKARELLQNRNAKLIHPLTGEILSEWEAPREDIYRALGDVYEALRSAVNQL